MQNDIDDSTSEAENFTNEKRQDRKKRRSKVLSNKDSDKLKDFRLEEKFQTFFDCSRNLNYDEIRYLINDCRQLLIKLRKEWADIKIIKCIHRGQISNIYLIKYKAFDEI
ncbi:MAG: hypothetical protein MHPSP_001486, partial [Paramarteilia canceri]